MQGYDQGKLDLTAIGGHEVDTNGSGKSITAFKIFS
jgi:hypothetical protein